MAQDLTSGQGSKSTTMQYYHIEDGVNEAVFKDYLSVSKRILVVCIESARCVRSRLVGRWQVFTLNAESGLMVPLNMFRLVGGRPQARLFKTGEGLSCYLLGLGVQVIVSPVRKGDGVEIDLEGAVSHHHGVSLRRRGGES